MRAYKRRSSGFRCCGWRRGLLGSFLQFTHHAYRCRFLSGCRGRFSLFPQDDNDLTHFDDLFLLGQYFENDARLGRGDFSKGLVCLHLNERGAFLQGIPFFDQPANNLAFGQPFPDVRKLEFVSHRTSPNQMPE